MRVYDQIIAAGQSLDFRVQKPAGPAQHLVLLLLLCLAGLGVSALAQTFAKPLSERDVVKLLKGGVTAERVEELVHERGIEFGMTAETERELRAALHERGASIAGENSLIFALREASPRSAATGSVSKSLSVGAEPTHAGLERTIGDLGIQSGLVAHNLEELEILKNKGERNYYDFRLVKNATTPVSTVRLQLMMMDPIKGRFTIDIIADDRTIEKKDRTVGEPLQFYTGSERLLYELVIFSRDKNSITGYLSTPKAAPFASAKSAEPDVSQMTLMEKLHYAKSLVQQQQFDRALEIYDIIAHEAPEPILYRDDMADAKRLKAEKEERERRQVALIAETDDARRNLEVYQDLVLKFDAVKDWQKAVFYQRKVCLVVNSPEAAQKLTELQRKLAEQQAGTVGKSVRCPEGYQRVSTSYGSYCSK